VHLDAGYDWTPCRQILAERGMVGQIATRGIPAPIQVGRRWVIERTHAWGNQYGKLRWCTERRRLAVELWRWSRGDSFSKTRWRRLVRVEARRQRGVELPAWTT
jgi:IS5 family transposase